MLPVALGLMALPIIYGGMNLAYEYLTGSLQRKRHANRLLSDLTGALMSGGARMDIPRPDEMRGPMAAISQASMQPFLMGIQSGFQPQPSWGGFGGQLPAQQPPPNALGGFGAFGAPQAGFMGGPPQFAQQAFSRMLPMALYPQMQPRFWG